MSIVELGTMTAAAKALSTTQSALSHRLAESERRLDAKLFERGPRRQLTPTRAGLAVHQAASRALADLERCESLVLAEDARVTAMVRIAVGSYDCYHWYPDLLRATRQQHPEVDLELVVVGDSPGSALVAGKVDIVVAPGHPTGAVKTRHLFDDELVLVVGPDHPLAARDWVQADELAAETYLTYNSAPTPGFEYDRFIRPSDVYPRIVRVVEQTSAITELVAAGAGVSVLSRWALSPAIAAGRIVPVRCGKAGLVLSWSAVLRADEPDDSPISAVADLFAEHLDT